MLRFSALTLLLVLLPTAAAQSPRGEAITSTFDTDAEGWAVFGDAEGGTATPDYNATGGNPGGYLSADDDVAGGTWYWDAPDAYLGNRSGSFERTLSFDLRQTATSNQFDNADLVLRGGGMELRFDTAENPGTDWTSYAVLLSTDAGWTVGDTEEAPTEAEFMAVLSDLTALRIRGEFRTGADTGSLDNVVLETDPATAAEPGAAASEMALSVWPNPARHDMHVSLTLSEAQHISVRVYNTLGKEVLRLHEGSLATGEHRLALGRAGLPAGFYLIQVKGTEGTATRRVTLLR